MPWTWDGRADAVRADEGGTATNINRQQDCPLAKRETLEFVRACYKILDAAVRKGVFELTKAVAKGTLGK